MSIAYSPAQQFQEYSLPAALLDHAGEKEEQK